MALTCMQMKQSISGKAQGIAHRAFFHVHVKGIQVNSHGGMAGHVHQLASLAEVLRMLSRIGSKLNAEGTPILASEFSDFVQTL